MPGLSPVPDWAVHCGRNATFAGLIEYCAMSFALFIAYILCSYLRPVGKRLAVVS